MTFKMKGFSAFTKQTMQGKPSYENKKESKLLPSEMEGTFVVSDNDKLIEPNKYQDDSRVKSIQNSINRLKQGKNN